MKLLHWFLLILSACFYSIAFLFTTFFWWLIFIFLFPFLYVLTKNNFSFKHGFIWAFILLLIHLSDTIFVLIGLSGAFWVVGLLLSVIMLLYLSCCAGILFWLLSACIRKYAITSPTIRICLYVFMVGIFFIWVDRYALCVIGRLEGYCLINPLLPIAQVPYFLHHLSRLGKINMIMILFFFQTAFFLSLLYKNKKIYVISLLLTCFWIYSFFCSYTKHVTIPFLAHMCVLPYTICNSVFAQEHVLDIFLCRFKEILIRFPHTEIIIMPESACSVFDSFLSLDAAKKWSAEYVGKPLHIIFGSTRTDGCNKYNTAYWVYDGIVQQWCDKRHAMLMTEQLSIVLNNVFFKNIYFNVDDQITVSFQPKQKITLTKDTDYVVYLCSELFFNENPDEMYQTLPIIVLVNDLLFSLYSRVHYIQKLLLLSARYKAIAWQREIMYVSYTYSFFINKQGICYSLNEW